MAEQIFQKIVIKSDNSVCLYVYDDVLAQNKKALSRRAFNDTSSTSDINGGTTVGRTQCCFRLLPSQQTYIL